MSDAAENVRISVQMHEQPVIVGTLDNKELGFVVKETMTAAALVSTVNHMVLALSQPGTE